MLAVKLIAILHNTLFIELPVRCIFDTPTVEGLAKTIKKVKKQGYSSVKEVIDFNSEIVLDPQIYPKNKFVKEEQITQPCNILLTGATGFLGAYLLDELLKTTKAKIYCLVRADNEHEALKRLQQNIDKYQINVSNINSRIIPICGNLEQPLLGLSVEQFQSLSEQIDTIYHSGAEVNFAKSYSAMKAANVMGTQEILRLACDGNKLKPLHYVSTVAVFSLIGYSDQPKILYENDDINNHEKYIYADIGYTQSKWVAENLVWIAKSRGVPVTVFRTGFLMGHSKTGHTYTDHYLFRLIKWCLYSTHFPNLVSQKLELIPVDYASKTIVHLSKQKQSLGNPFHIVPIHSQNITFIDLFNLISSYYYQLNKVPYQQWIDEIIHDSINNQNNPLFPLLGLLTEKVDGDLTIMESYQNTPDLDCQNTLNGLANTSINCPPMNAQLIDTYLSYLIKIGFIQPPSKNDNAIPTNNVARPKASHMEC